MEVIYSLIPSMIVIGLVMVGILIWAIRRGQYDDLDGDGNRILMDEDDPLLPKNKIGTAKKAAQRDQRNWPDADDD